MYKRQLLWVGWRCGLAGWNVWGLGIAASCYCLFYLGTVLRRTTRENIPAYQRGIFAAAAFAVLLILGRLGSVGLAGNGYSSPIFLLVTSLAGWVLVREAACLTAPLPCVRAVLAYLGREQIAEQLSGKAVTEIIAVILAYAIKSLVENLSKHNNWPDRSGKKEETTHE